MAEQSTRLWLLRHGRPEGPDCFRGRIDPPLSQQGLQAMMQAVSDRPRPDRVISSPLRRCAEFARIWAWDQDCPLVIDPAVIELDFGRWDGLVFSDAWAQELERVQAFWQDPYRNGPPEGEAIADFEVRVQQALERWLRDYSGEQLLLVAHGGVLRALMKWALALPADSLSHLQALEIGYACLIELEIYTDADGRHWPRLVGLYPADAAQR